jgi:hypothetical protein
MSISDRQQQPIMQLEEIQQQQAAPLGGAATATIIAWHHSTGLVNRSRDHIHIQPQQILWLFGTIMGHYHLDAPFRGEQQHRHTT